jgi:hypothetical protein
MAHPSGLDPEKLLNGASLFLVAFFTALPMDWRKLVKISLVLVIFEGAIRKWFLPGLSQFVYFGKDFLMIIAYAKYYSSKEPREKGDKLDPLLMFFLIGASLWVVIQAGNFSLGSPVIGLIGVRNYLVFFPLLFIMQHLFRNQNELASFLKWYLALCIPVVGLSVIQHYAPPNSPLNIYVSEEDTAKALVGARVRATGTFSYIAGFAAYLQVTAALVIPLLMLQIGRFWHHVVQLVLVAVIVGILFSGSRTPVIAVGLFVVGYLISNKVLRKMGLYRKLAIPAFFVGMVLIYLLASALESMVERFSDDALKMRIYASITTPFDYMVESGITGFGSGATYQANGKIRDMFGLPEGDVIPVFYESEPERIMLEIGPIGFFLWYGLRLRLIMVLWQTYTALTMPLLRELALSAFLVHAIAFSGQMVFQVTLSFYYWFLAGFITLLPLIERKELASNESSDEPEMSSSELQDDDQNLDRGDWSWERDRL